jgi:hypothetical protein
MFMSLMNLICKYYLSMATFLPVIVASIWIVFRHHSYLSLPVKLIHALSKLFAQVAWVRFIQIALERRAVSHLGWPRIQVSSIDVDK